MEISLAKRKNIGISGTCQRKDKCSNTIKSNHLVIVLLINCIIHSQRRRRGLFLKALVPKQKSVGILPVAHPTHQGLRIAQQSEWTTQKAHAWYILIPCVNRPNTYYISDKSRQGIIYLP